MVFNMYNHNVSQYDTFTFLSWFLNGLLSAENLFSFNAIILFNDLFFIGAGAAAAASFYSMRILTKHTKFTLQTLFFSDYARL